MAARMRMYPEYRPPTVSGSAAMTGHSVRGVKSIDLARVMILLISTAILPDPTELLVVQRGPYSAVHACAGCCFSPPRHRILAFVQARPQMAGRPRSEHGPPRGPCRPTPGTVVAIRSVGWHSRLGSRELPAVGLVEEIA